MSAAGCLLASFSIFLGAVLWSRTNDALQQVQQSRVDLCRQANERHDAVLRVLDQRIRELHGPARVRAEASRAGSVALLEAIAPKRDCQAALTPPPLKP